ncbi:hypothetical protein FPSE_11436 [Fusarium pseudograminearum CS3096]|uniref:CHAT domain-containing protein n=1 Tax=Fusarium pseudograminearum (strain CS3096) TaxID=1028729 RepID=K3V8Z5_FUSPC|nr:hypothetical protein FPSE_11436 [Fusarium pseudograminearum CS3096]EKJ68428.1 hypothetical protein FPSE_11436 [Fusarium pseudograminearum CS3096]
MDSITQTIQKARQAADAIPKHSPDRPSRLARLAKQLNRKYSATGATDYLDEGIELLRIAVRASPDDDPNRGRIVHSLSSQLHDRYIRQKSVPDLLKAVLVARDSIDACGDDDPALPLFWGNLGSLLIDRYYAKGFKSDLHEAVDCTRKALNMMDKRNPLRATLLDKLSVALGHLHWRAGSKSDPKVQRYIEDAISASREAVALTPKHHPRLAGRLKNLGTHLGHKYHLAGTNSGLQECIKCHVAALRAEQSPTLRRIQAADDALPYCADLKDWNLAFNVATNAVALFPKLIFRSHQHSDKLHMLGKVSGLASDAAAMALNAGKGLDVVLAILERGRGLLSQSMEEMRTDRASLKAQHPQYAEELDRIRAALDFPLKYNDSLEDPEETWEAESILRKKADKMLDDLLAKIRKQPGFEDYLLPPSETAMRAAAQKGPIVVINVSQFRCDAIIVKPDRLHLLPLPKLTLSAVEDAYMAEPGLPSVQPSGPLPQGPVSNSNYNIWEAFVSNMGWDGPLTNPASSGLSRKPSNALGSPKVLRWLWETTAKPVLDYLGYKAIPKDGKWPHLWWIPTGSLSRFAIHAAGDYYPGTSETVLDRTVSSYSSSIKSIIQSRRRRIAVHKSPYALLVAMETTKGCSSMLPFASKEVSLVGDICRSMSLRPLQPGKQKRDIVPHLRDCTIFHFAGHGQSDDKDPLNSRLLLNDSRSDPFTVTSLFDTKLHDNPPFLAYLSACGTGRMDNDRFSDEGIHLISACQLAGFRHVIGTLWEVNDESCVEMARVLYENIKHQGITDDAVSRGLHAAARRLRDAWSRKFTDGGSRGGVARRKKQRSPEIRRNGGRDIIACDDDDDGTEPLYWIPFVHFGV